MTTTKTATPSLNQEGVFAATNPAAAAFAAGKGYAAPFLSDEAKYAASQAAQKAALTTKQPKP